MSDEIATGCETGAKMLVKIIDAAAVPGGKCIALCDEFGEIIPMQSRAVLDNQVGNFGTITVTFAIDGKHIKFAENNDAARSGVGRADANNIVPLMLLPMSEWEMRPVNDGIGQSVGIGIYAKTTTSGGYCRVWFKWPWACLPNNVVGVNDLARCGVLGEFMAYREAIGA